MQETLFTAFQGERLLAAGPAAEVAPLVAEAQARGASGVLVFDDGTGEQAELDLRTVPPTIAARGPAKASRGRPKLGVTAREVTLLPRHWEWLAAQPGGASAALRRLVEAASRSEDASTQRRDVVHRAMTVLAGDLPGYEAATRALFARDAAGLEAILSGWPADIRTYLARLGEEPVR
jgi:hypothetical protein